MRTVIDREQFTPFGIWIRQYLRDSREGLSVTNLDYVIEDFRNRRLMLLEEKGNGGAVGRAQGLTFKVLDRILRLGVPHFNYEYWGFYVLQFPHGKDMPGPGMTLNDHPITTEQLVKHLNFDEPFCEPRRL